MSGIITLSKARGGGVVGPDGLPGGTKMLFHQTTAPTGWTKVTAIGTGSDDVDDTALRVVTGTITDGVGGSEAFETAFAAVTPTISMTNASHTLAAGEIAAHTHDANPLLSGSGPTTHGAKLNPGPVPGTFYYDTNMIPILANSPAGGGHSHSNSASSSEIDLDVKFVDVIIAEKD